MKYSTYLFYLYLSRRHPIRLNNLPQIPRYLLSHRHAMVNTKSMRNPIPVNLHFGLPLLTTLAASSQPKQLIPSAISYPVISLAKVEEELGTRDACGRGICG